MKKLLSAVMAGILSVAVVGCAQTSKTASDVSSVSSISSTVSSDTSSVAESSAPTSSAPVSSQAAGLQAVSSKTAVTRTAAEPASSAPSSPAPSSSTPASSTPDDTQQKIDAENARHTAALAALKTEYDKNVAIFDELDEYEDEWVIIINKLAVETDQTKIEELQLQKNSCGVKIYLDLKKVAPILYPDLKYMKSLDDYSRYFTERHRVNVSVKVLRYEMQQKYNNDVTAENDKHNEIMKQLS